MKKSLVLLLFLFSISLLHSEEEEMNEESPFSSTQKSVLVWKGDVVGVYKNRLWIKVRIYRNQKISKLSLSELKSKIQVTKEYPVYQKLTEVLQGKFVVRDTIFEEKNINKKNQFMEVVLVGDYLADPNSKMKEITTDAYIASFVQEDFYREPDAFFKGRYTTPRKTIFHPKDRKEMVLVSRGFLLYGQGTDPSSDNFNPYFLNPTTSSIKELPSYYIDKYEVTNAEYAYFLKQTNGDPPPHWIRGSYPVGEENYPVVHLTYREVEKYASWVGKRIPSEFEWEKAARGPGVIEYVNRDESLGYQITATKYPYGDEFDPLFCITRESNREKPVSVYDLSTEGASPYGVLGMCGNAPEWTSSYYELYPGHHIKNFSFGKIYKVIRGGGYSESAKNSSAIARTYGGIPNLAEDRRAGFRLVMDYRD